MVDQFATNLEGSDYGTVKNLAKLGNSVKNKLRVFSAAAAVIIPLIYFYIIGFFFYFIGLSGAGLEESVIFGLLVPGQTIFYVSYGVSLAMSLLSFLLFTIALVSRKVGFFSGTDLFVTTIVFALSVFPLMPYLPWTILWAGYLFWTR